MRELESVHYNLVQNLSLVIFKSVSEKNPLNHEFFRNSGVSTYYMVEVWKFMGSAKFRPVSALQGPTGAL